MATLEKRIDRLEQITVSHHHNYKLLTHHDGKPKPVIPGDGQPYIVVSFVKPKQWEPDHDES